MIIFDIITGTLQSILIVYTISNCILEKSKNLCKYIVLISLLILAASNFVMGIFGDNRYFAIFLTHILSLIIISIFYRKNIILGIAAYTIIYTIMEIYCILCANIIFELAKSILYKKYINYEIVLIIHIPQWILIYLCIRYISKVKEIFKLIIREKLVFVNIIVSFLLDFILSFYLLTLGNSNELIETIIEVIFLMCLVIISIYFVKISHKSKEIHELNKSLDTKNKELGKVKYEYGTQISYLYGLCLMEKFDELKKSLKKIINVNSQDLDSVEVDENKNSLASLILKSAKEKGIHIISECSCELAMASIPEMDLYRILSNIVDNAVKAMNECGIIIFKTYEKSGNIVIKIENNGPKIEENMQNKIFEAGFTTKNNKDKSHGFGLSIVKELIENHLGTISLKSNDVSTEFKIIIPITKNTDSKIS